MADFTTILAKKFFIVTISSLLFLTILTLGLNNQLQNMLVANAKTTSKKNLTITKNLSPTPKVKNAVQNINRLDPQKPIIKSLKLDQYTNHVDDLVSINSDNSDIEIKNIKGKVKLKIPSNIVVQSYEVLENKIVYSGDVVQSTIELVDGGVRQVINIESINAPNFYDFPINLEQSQTLTLNEDGSANIKNKENQIVLFIAKPWARDNHNKELRTWYEITSAGLRQHINLSNAVFPVVADPVWCGNAINYVEWINRDDQWSASNKATWCGYWNCGGQWSCWQESYDKTPTCARYSGWVCATSPWNKQWNILTNIGRCTINLCAMLILQKVLNGSGIWNLLNLIGAIGDLFRIDVINMFYV